MLNSLDASGRLGGVRFFASGAYTNDAGALKNMGGEASRRARVNLDYDPRSNTTISISTLFDRSSLDLRNSNSAASETSPAVRSRARTISRRTRLDGHCSSEASAR